jgi:hypothetical protein
VKQLFIELLKRRGDVLFETPPWWSHDATAVKAELQRRDMRAYSASVRIQSLRQEVDPDGARRNLRVAIDLAIFGHTLPDKVLKIGGEAAAETAVGVGEHADLERIKSQMLREVTEAALAKAIAATERKIELVAAQEKPGR